MKLTFAIVFLLILSHAALSGCATFKAEKASPPAGQFVDIDGVRLHVLDTGPVAGDAGPPIVLIHGASVNLLDMKLALGDELSRTHRVIMVDRPGRGYSERPKDGWRLDLQARLIHDAAASLGAERPIVVGQSFGGAVALAYALQHQDDLSGLVLLAPVSHPWPGGVAWYNRVAGWPAVGFLFRRLVIPVYAPGAARRGVVNSFGAGGAPENYFDEAGIGLLFRAKDFKSNAADLRNLKAQITTMSARYGEIRVPTAIFVGDADKTVSPDIHARRLVTEIPGATLEVFPGVGHALHHEKKAPIIAAIEAMAAIEMSGAP